MAQTPEQLFFNQSMNEHTAIYYAVCVTGAAGMFIIFGAIRRAARHYEPRERGLGSRLVSAVTRSSQRTMTRKVPGFVSAGHAVLFISYIAINAGLVFQNMDRSLLMNWARRLGWMTLLNLALTTFLSLKNTPLAWFSVSSYEQLNIIHKAAGCTTALLAIIHPTVFLATLSQGGYLFVIKEFLHFSGAIAACCMLLTVSVAILLRNLRYELFYVIHVILFMVIIIMIGFHRPSYATKSAYITTFAGSVWTLDRLIRFTRLSWNSISNTAIISPLPNGGTLIILNKRVARMESGKHAFLWMPEIRTTETHPFTAVSNHPLKFVVSAHNGFTRDLHDYAVKNPGATLKASVDGPYGVLPSFCTYDRVLLIAGGSGASFTFGVALNMLDGFVNSSRKPAIEFVWVVRHEENISWFEEELEKICASPSVNVTIHVTIPNSPTKSSNDLPIPVQDTMDLSIEVVPDPFSNADDKTTREPDIEKISATIRHLEKVPQIAIGRPMCRIHAGRPDVESIITGAVSVSHLHEHLVVAACGPNDLMQVVRNSVANNINIKGPSVDFHFEQFEW